MNITLIELVLKNHEAALALLAAGGSLVYRVADAMKYRKRDNIKSLLERQRAVYALLDELKDTVNADRVALMAAHNGNRSIQANTINLLYSSIVAAVEDNALRGSEQRWQKQPVDLAYNENLERVHAEKVVRVEVKSMREGIESAFLRADGVRVAYLAEVKCLEKSRYHWLLSSRRDVYKYFYLSCQWQAGIIVDPALQDRVRVFANRISKLI